MKALLKLLITLFYLIYAVYFINEKSHTDGAIGFIGASAAVAISGYFIYALIWSKGV